MEFEAAATVTFKPPPKVRLADKIQFTSPSSIPVWLSSTADDGLSVALKIVSDDPATAGEIATMEVRRVAHLFAFMNHLRLQSIGAPSLTHTYTDESGTAVHCGAGTVDIMGRLATVKILRPDDDDQIRLAMEHGYSEQYMAAVDRWIEAVNEDSHVLRFLLLYRLLEFLLGGEEGKPAERVLRWAKQNEETPETIQDRGQTVSIYTHLRNDVHPKTPLYPFDAVNRWLPRFETLVWKRVQALHDAPDTN